MHLWMGPAAQMPLATAAGQGRLKGDLNDIVRVAVDRIAVYLCHEEPWNVGFVDFVSTTGSVIEK